MKHLPYKQRTAMLRSHIPQNYASTQFRYVNWIRPKLVDNYWPLCEQGLYEGLVFRKTTDDFSASIYRMKTDFEAEFLCVGFLEGKGKHTGTLGALEIITSTGVPGTVGGGFTDEDRDHIWSMQQYYLNKRLKVRGKSLFPSGLLRHPNFTEWLDD